MGEDMTQLPFRSATELAAVVRAGEVSSIELLECYLDRIEALNPGLGAVVTLDAERARREAADADRRLAQGAETGPLHGLPVTVKDCLETAGMRTTCGAPELAGYVPEQDAEAVGRLRRARAIVIGKTNLPVWAIQRRYATRVRCAALSTRRTTINGETGCAVAARPHSPHHALSSRRGVMGSGGGCPGDAGCDW